MTASDVKGDLAKSLEIEQLKAKYDEERNKRLRPDGIRQYIKIADEFAHFDDDPFSPRTERGPLTDECEVAVIGGGFGGLLAGAMLREAGIGDIRMIEQGGGFGGAWYWNRYPGAQCDTESYIYLPLLEETGFVPREKYSFGPEIREHADRIAKHYDLYRRACFHTVVRSLNWDESERRWVISTDRNDRMRARFVILANGLLSRPKLPGIPGISSFKGRAFHTSRWDYSYTGGNTLGGMHKLADKRVAVVGTGATGIQCVPYLARDAEHLYLFQRTPAAVDVRNNRPTDPEWASTLEPGWQKNRMTNFLTIVSGGKADVDLVDDGWTDLFRNVPSVLAGTGGSTGSGADAAAQAAEIADFLKMNEIRARVDAIVADAATAEALKPWYQRFCKRPGFHDEFLQAFNRPNVTLVDTMGRGVDEIVDDGLIAGGQKYDVDCIVFATGFEVGTAYAQRAGYEIFGKGGRSLSDHWADGRRSLHGFLSAGFPNCFNMGTAVGLAANNTHMLREYAEHIAYVIGEAAQRGATRVEVTAIAEAEWTRTMKENPPNQEFLARCTPGYFNNEGVTENNQSFLRELFGKGPLAFFELLRIWREEGNLAGLDIE